MRELVLDTETTGFEPSEGHRLVEIGIVELVNHMPTGQTYHQYINPERDVPQGAFEVHGLSQDYLSQFPTFREIAAGFVEFVGSDRMVIHNAAFDMRFLNAELGWLGMDPLPDAQALDTLALARRKFPGSPASLDALCRRFSIDNSAREKHGALLDAEILAEVYLELIGGQQPDFALSNTAAHAQGGREGAMARPQPLPRRPQPLRPRLTEEEALAHAQFVATLGDAPIWDKYRADQ